MDTVNRAVTVKNNVRKCKSASVRDALRPPTFVGKFYVHKSNSRWAIVKDSEAQSNSEVTQKYSRTSTIHQVLIN